MAEVIGSRVLITTSLHQQRLLSSVSGYEAGRLSQFSTGNEEADSTVGQRSGLHLLPFPEFQRPAPPSPYVLHVNVLGQRIKFEMFLPVHMQYSTVGIRTRNCGFQLLALFVRSPFVVTLITWLMGPDVLPIHAQSESPSETAAPSKSNGIPLPLPLPLVRNNQESNQKNLVKAGRYNVILTNPYSCTPVHCFQFPDEPI